ncbi:DUF2817 domain-containing protein [Novosphingobium sp. THN1]|nr:DUF2817 domain-containing protein [Novosphingobium sp. THN1]
MLRVMLFPNDYVDARERFRTLASRRGFALESYEHPAENGPQGETLSCDVARLGPSDAERVILISSGAHGVEGFCGSGCQAELLASGLLDGLPGDTAVVLVHAVNPYGFAWLRRTNEDNIDLNRNFVDHSVALANPGYDEIHNWLVPRDWDGPARTEADAAIDAYIAERGLRAFQVAMTSGQYTHPDGLFYGGKAPAWSNETWRSLLRKHCANASQVIAIDIHTGLGPRGVGEVICVTSEAEYLMAKAIFGEDVTWTGGGEAVSAQVGGSLAHAAHHEIGSEKLVMVALEFGTYPIPETLEALRAETWLVARGNLKGEQADSLKKALKDAFYIDEPDWQMAVTDRFLGLFRRMKECRP